MGNKTESVNIVCACYPTSLAITTRWPSESVTVDLRLRAHCWSRGWRPKMSLLFVISTNKQVHCASISGTNSLRTRLRGPLLTPPRSWWSSQTGTPATETGMGLWRNIMTKKSYALWLGWVGNMKPPLGGVSALTRWTRAGVSQAPFQVGGRLLETLVVEFWSIIGKPETWVYTLNSLSPCILLHLIVLYE